MNGYSPLPLGERLEVEEAIDAAFAPLRAARTDLSPLRVRAAVRWGRGAPPPEAVRWSGAIARLSELSVAVGMSVVIFGAALGPAAEQPNTAPAPSRSGVEVGAVALAEEREMRAERREWAELLRSRLDAFRLDRYVPLQDWLDPTVVRPAAQRPYFPAPRGTVTQPSGPF